MSESERVCKYCMVSESIAEELDKIEICEYCTHKSHEWVDID